MNSECVSERVLTPQELRKILNTDNMEIVKLCRKACVVPVKDEEGKTYFTMEDARLLQRAKNSADALMPKSSSQIVVNNLLSSLKQMESNITDTINDTITGSVTKLLDERLEGMDEVVVELIRCKTENENLKNKINELNKENYKLKNSINSFKPLALGFYVKQQEEDNILL